MKQIIQRAVLAGTSLLTVLTFAAVPAGAHAGPDGGTGSGTSGNAIVVADATDDTVKSLRSQALSNIQQRRAGRQERTAAVKQRACEVRQNSIDRRTHAYGAAAARHLDTFNAIFARVKTFQTNKQLNVSNYDTLVAAAADKQTAAQSAVEALQALDVNIDCSQLDPATTLATVQQAVKDAHDALQAYRAAIKDVVVALKGASTAQSTTDSATDTTGGDQ